MLDSEHPNLETTATDRNSYTLGSIGEHNIVIATLPKGQTGTNSAAAVAVQMVNTFPNIKFGLMVGIGGGVPPKVRLGDVVVSVPGLTDPGVIQWDLGKAVEGGSGFERTGTLDNPPRSLLTALSKVETKHALGVFKIPDYLVELKEKYPSLAPKYLKSEALEDVAFKLNAPHIEKITDEEEEEEEDDDENTCRFCDKTKTFKENNRGMLVHFGLIASGNKVVKDAKVRNQINKELGGKVLCFEMEAAGLSNVFPCLVIRGICDYADAHKNKIWQEHAAAVAAAFSKELLGYVQVTQVEQEKPAKELLNQISDIVSRIEVQVTKLKSNWDQKENREVLQWLTEADYGLIHTDKIREKQAGTGEWFLESPQFREWYQNAAQTIFCPGRPGAGKTIITATVIDRILKLHGQDDQIGIAYIYFNYKNVNEQKTEKVFASLLKQLTQKLPEVPTCMKELYQQHKKNNTHPVIEEYLKTLDTVASLHSKVFILIDALDECDTSCREAILSGIISFQSRSPVNIFLTSRPIPDIERFFMNKPRLEIYGSENDLKQYMEENCKPILRVLNDRRDLWEEIMRRTIDAANGIFLLVKLRLDSLGSMISENEILKMIEKGPGSDSVYDDAYEEVMNRIYDQPKRSSQHAIRALSWITGSKRLLTTLEFRHALGVQIGQSKFDERDIPDLERLISLCCGLLMIDQESDVIRLVHYTAQEYLMKMQKQWLPQMESNLAESCITYLLYDTFVQEGASATREDFDSRLELYPLYDYAARYWGHHAHEAAIEEKPLVLRLLVSYTAVSACSQVLAMTNYYGDKVNSKWTWLHLAAFFGMHGLIKTLLSGETELDAQDHIAQTPLSVAAKRGHIEVVKLLAEKGAAVEVTDGERSALSLTAAEGHQAVANFLIERGANIESTESFFYRTPLMFAVMFKRQAMVTLLLKHGANLNAKDFYESDSLWFALETGDESIVRLLVEKGSNIDRWDKYGRTPLMRMIEKGDEAMVRVLVDCGAGLEVVNKSGQTPLLLAMEQRREATARLLIEKGADVESSKYVDGYGRTPLCWAAFHGQLAIVKALVEKYADPDSKATAHLSPLSQAAGRGHKEVVIYLLQKGANIESTDWYRARTPLSWAAEGGSEATVRVLVERGANIGAVDREKITPLSWAARSGREAVARILIESGANLEARDSYGYTSLISAAQEGHEAVVRMLIEKGADLESGYKNASGRFRSRTALLWAAGQGQEAVVRLLVEKGANIEATDYMDHTPLTLAIEEGHDTIANFLVEKGAKC
ncbi:hypothetical protein TWF694_006016 [Orbilia ellipsospora]|uniref:Nucleoside phosphorylase domain-containing protein n=1 Tax=Orbilia ellipsospora TaxID=2528407 RepID=A0AAV9WR87_9PEZI